MYVCRYVRKYVCMYVCMYVHIYIYIYIYICVPAQSKYSIDDGDADMLALAAPPGISPHPIYLSSLFPLFFWKTHISTSK